MDSYQDAIRATAAKHSPWYVVPADKKWFARVVVAGALYEALAGLRLRYPDVGPEKKKELAAARAQLMREAKSAPRFRTRPVAPRPAPGPRPAAEPSAVAAMTAPVADASVADAVAAEGS
jgi:hypothetical protein